MVPEAQKDFLGGVFGVGVVGQQRAREAVNIVTMPLAEQLEFKFAYHGRGIQRMREWNCYKVCDQERDGGGNGFLFGVLYFQKA